MMGEGWDLTAFVVLKKGLYEMSDGRWAGHVLCPSPPG